MTIYEKYRVRIGGITGYVLLTDEGVIAPDLPGTFQYERYYGTDILGRDIYQNDRVRTNLWGLCKMIWTPAGWRVQQSSRFNNKRHNAPHPSNLYVILDQHTS